MPATPDICATRSHEAPQCVCPATLMKRARSAWRAMRKRCLSPSSDAWHRYGGVGIKICPQWMVFEQFLRDMGLPPTPVHWLGRKDVAGHYTPGNCIWTDHASQQRRRQFCVQIPLKDGRTLTASEVARIPGMPGFAAIRNRWAQGFSLELPQPKRLYRKSRWVTWQGETLPLPQWAVRLGLTPQVLGNRIDRMPLAKAMTPQAMRIHRVIDWAGERLPLKVWAARLNLSARCLRLRIASGMPLAQAMTPGRLRPGPKKPQSAHPTRRAFEPPKKEKP